MQFLMLDHT